MNRTTDGILSLIDVEINNLQQARALLSGESPKKKAGRPRLVATPTPTLVTKFAKKKRSLSSEGRARISEAMKARWAKRKKAKATV
jgi:hypothetical protein